MINKSFRYSDLYETATYAQELEDLRQMVRYWNSQRGASSYPKYTAKLTITAGGGERTIKVPMSDLEAIVNSKVLGLFRSLAQKGVCMGQEDIILIGR